MLIVLLILFALSLLALATIHTSDTDMTIAGNHTKRTQAFLAAEAGMARADYILSSNPDMTNRDSLTAQINDDTLLPNAHFRVSMGNTLPQRQVVATGVSNPGEAVIQVEYRHRLNPYNIWNNAIFAGHGQNGNSIGGNVGVHGSVHILGDGEPFTDSNGDGNWDIGEPYTDANHDGAYDPPLDPATAALDMTGTATLSNNYSGLPAVLASRTPTLPTYDYQGESVQSIESELRVKNGNVILDGNAKVGQPNATGGSPAIKEQMDGVYVTDGFSGSSASAGVFSDNGYTNGYDLGDLPVKMPNLDAPYTDSLGVTHASYMSYLRSNALVIPGNLTIQSGVAVAPIANAFGSVSVDALGNMTISGVVYVEGNVVVQGGSAVKYDGRFTLVSEGDTHINTDFYSKDMFPTDDVAGVISYGRIELGTAGGAAQLNLQGAFFAQEEVINGKQNNLTGSIVGNYFSMSQVPNIFQVPSLVDNLPPGMPGGEVYRRIWWRVARSWVELG